jgi:hypothetical protein
MLGCDPSSSFIAEIPLPSSGIVGTLWRWTPPVNSSQPCGARTSPGCVSNGTAATCAFPLATCTTERWSGLVSLDARGALQYTYSGAGSSRCDGIATPGRLGQPLAIMSLTGDVVTWDNSAVTYVEGSSGVVAWSKPIFPATLCPDGHTSVSLTNNSKLMFSVTTTAEVFGVLADGIPLGSINLLANVSGDGGVSDGGSGDATGPRAAEGGPRGRATAQPAEAQHTLRGSSPHPLVGVAYPGSYNGLYVPIAQPAIDGARTLVLARLYDGNVSASERPLITPTPRLFLAAVDQHDTIADRLQFIWQLELPLAAEIIACVPAAAGRFPGAEPVMVTGPLVLPNHTVVFGVACNASAEDAAAANTTVYSVAIDVPWPVVPAVLWTSSLSPQSPLAPLPLNGTTINALTPLAPSMARDPRSVGEPAVASSIWMTCAAASDVVQLDGGSGAVRTRLDIAALLRDPGTANASTCALVPLFEGAPARAAMWYPTSAVLTSTAAGDNTTAVLVLGGGVAGPTLPVGTPAFWLLGLTVAAEGSPSASVVWCTPTPADGSVNAAGTFPFVGQLAPLSAPVGTAADGSRKRGAIARADMHAWGTDVGEGLDVSGTAQGTVLMLAMPDGIYGVGVPAAGERSGAARLSSAQQQRL